MSIQNYLNQIKTAVFGKDVRQSIHDAIKQCYDDASVDHDNANMEVKLARGTHETLNDRITENEKNQEKLSSDLDTIQSLNVDYFGAIGNGETNDTEFINNAINSNFLNKRKITLSPNKIYMVDKIEVKSNTIIDFNGGMLKKTNTNTYNYQILHLEDVENVIIINPIIIGDKDEHTGTTGEWGHGINIVGNCKNITIINPNISKCWGDGIYIGTNTTNKGTPTNIHIIGQIRVEECRRQGISISKGKDIYIDDVICNNIIGTEPAMAIDLEPNNDTDLIDNININSIKSYNCNGALNVVARGGIVNINIGNIYSDCDRYSSVRLVYSEVSDNTQGNVTPSTVNLYNTINIDNIYVKGSTYKPITINRPLKGSMPNINIGNINVNDITYSSSKITDTTVEWCVVGVLSDRAYENNTFGNIRIDNIIVGKIYGTNNIQPIVCIDRTTKNSIIDNVKLFNYSLLDTSIVSNLQNPTISFNKTVNCVFNQNSYGINIIDTGNLGIKTGLNIVNVQDINLNDLSQDSVLYIKSDSLRFNYNSRLKNGYTINLNGVQETNSSSSIIWQMKNRVVFIKKDEATKTINIIYQNLDILKASSSPGGHELIKGAIMFLGGINNYPIYCDGINWRKFSDDSIVF